MNWGPGRKFSMKRYAESINRAMVMLATLGCALLILPSAHAERRVALIIGNSAYVESPLSNPINDARDIRAKLLTMGFAAGDIVYRENLKTTEIGEVQREFRERLGAGGDTVALVFYAGHGVQSAGENYFPAVDAKLRSEEDLPQYSLRLVKLMELLEQAKTRLNLVFLDACRNNPLARKTRSGTRGLARVEAPSGTLITFATQPNAVADDGNGRNGVFTQNLLAHIDTPGMELEAMLKRVVRGVRQDTQERQSPWKEGAIDLDFYLVPGTAGRIEKLSGWDSPTPASVEDLEALSKLMESRTQKPPKSSRIEELSGSNPPSPATVEDLEALSKRIEARGRKLPTFSAVTQESDTAGLAGRLAELLRSEAARRKDWARLGGAAVSVGFEEDLSRRAPRESRVYGRWTFAVADRPDCLVQFASGWLGRSGLGGLALSRDEAVTAGRNLVVEHIALMLKDPDRVDWCPLVGTAAGNRR